MFFIGSLSAGYYAVKRYNNKLAEEKGDIHRNWHHDPSFIKQNIPLYLTQVENRDQMLANVRYELILLLTKEKGYEGKVTVEFKLKDKEIADLFLDFHGKAISELTVNG